MKGSICIPVSVRIREGKRVYPWFIGLIFLGEPTRRNIYIYICMNFDVGFNSTSLKVFEVPMMRDI